MEKGDYVRTLRFGTVKIEEIFESRREAERAGYTETAHYWDDPVYGISGKSLDMYHMQFAAYKKND